MVRVSIPFNALQNSMRSHPIHPILVIQYVVQIPSMIPSSKNLPLRRKWETPKSWRHRLKEDVHMRFLDAY